jgi:membrane-associated phospholipid phosphatase
MVKTLSTQALIIRKKRFMINLNIVSLPEPKRSAELMKMFNAWINSHEYMIKIVPITADIFVFSYPIILVALYLYGEWGDRISRLEYKLYSLYIASSAAWAVLINAIIQSIVLKDRPEGYIEQQEFLLLSHLPTDPFPSDHAGVSAAIAASLTIRAYHKKESWLVWMSVYARFACIMMSVSRVGVAIHWPMDTVAGIVVWTTIAYLLRYSALWEIWKTYCAMPLISLQNKIFTALSLQKKHTTRS